MPVGYAIATRSWCWVCCAVGISYEWRRKRNNLRRSIFKDFYDAMNKLHPLAFTNVTARP